MPKVTPTSTRKADHIRINLEEDVRSGLTTGLEHYRFTHQALPEINLDDVNLKLSLFGKVLAAPILISSMTGGTEEAGRINRTLAEAAQETGIAMGLGSQRAAIEHPELVPTFQVREVGPKILLFANLGAIQLNYGYDAEDCQRAVDMIEADALILHLNPLQEAVQPEGETNFAGLAADMRAIAIQLNALDAKLTKLDTRMDRIERHLGVVPHVVVPTSDPNAPKPAPIVVAPVSPYRAR